MSDRVEQINKALKDLDESSRIANENFVKSVEGLDPHSEEYLDKLMQLAESDNARWYMCQHLREEKEEAIKHEKDILDRSSITIPLEEYNRLQNELRKYKEADKITSQIAKEIVHNYDEHLLERLKVDAYFNVANFSLTIQVYPRSFI